MPITRLEMTPATYTHGKWYVFTDKEHKDEVMEHIQDVLEAVVHADDYVQAFPNTKPRINQGPMMPMKYISFIQSHCSENLQNTDTTSLRSPPNAWKVGPPKVTQQTHSQAVARYKSREHTSTVPNLQGIYIQEYNNNMGYITIYMHEES